jgi:hypothetical protein
MVIPPPPIAQTSVETPVEVIEKVSLPCTELNQLPEAIRPTSTESATRYTFWKYPRLRPAATSPPKPPIIVRSAYSDTKPFLIPAIRQIPTVPLPLVIIACLLCLLLGSLSRSLLSEADFVIYLPAGAQFPPGREWRELRRVVEWTFFPGRDLVVAVSKRI